MELTAYSPGCGTVVDGVQLAELSDRELEDLRAAFRDHGLLFFRDQTLTPDQHLDHSYDDKPALGSILVARELPSKGGDTRFAKPLQRVRGAVPRIPRDARCIPS